MPTNDTWLPGLGGGVPSLANQAAVELDNLLLRRGSEVPAARKLAELIAGDFTAAQSSAHGAATVGIMNRALAAAKVGSTPLTRVEEVVAQAEQIALALRRIADDPVGYREKNAVEIEQLRAFCLAYAVQLAATRRSRTGGPQHPYRR